MDRDWRILRLTALAATILTSAPAAAQAPPKADACAHERATVGESGALDTKKPDRGNLSDQLARSGGVICPPSQVDPAIKAPTPPGGSMPVIPPPGSPGGDPKVQPK